MRPRLLPLFVALALGALGAGPARAAATVQDPAPAPAPAPEAAAAGVPTLALEAPAVWLPGEPCEVVLRITAPAGGYDLPLWMLGVGALELEGRALGERGEGTLTMAPGQVLESRLDLGEALAAHAPEGGGLVELTVSLPGVRARTELHPFSLAPEGLDFMTMEPEELAQWEVVMLTTQGTLWFEFFPDTAPNHVRNFLDLSYTGFYDGSGFHRVIPGFMAQGGRAKPGEKAPRTLRAEFSTRKHVPGVLSAARLGHDIDSATSEFFVMHAKYPGLDGQYSVYGQLIEGLDVVDRLVQTGDHRYSPQSPKGYTPTTPQLIERAIVVRARPRAEQPAEGEQKKD